MGIEKGIDEHTGAQGVVRPLELFAWRKFLALGSNALEVVGVVLEAGGRHEPRR